MEQKTFALFPEAAFGPALNSVGIAQALTAMGHKVVFLSDPGFVEVYEGYGFEAHPASPTEHPKTTGGDGAMCMGPVLSKASHARG